MDVPIEEVLLKEVASLQKHYDFISQLSGENFNIFRTLQLEVNEVRTHSAVLAEFLNPKGSHGQKDLFLKLFTECYHIENFDTSSATADVEAYIGPINNDYTVGGRIDILITDCHRNHIMIENKIYAGDQKNQLLRYYHSDTSAKLFYLNLDGRDPLDWSTGERLDKEKFQVISYSNDILNWLENCRKEAVSLPIIRETISQYIQLINYLTGHSINSAMEKELASKISRNQEYISSAFKISNSLELVTSNLLKDFRLQLDEIARELKFDIYPEDINLGEGRESYYWFYLQNPKHKDAAIGFVFEEGRRWLSVGIDISEADKTPDLLPLQKEISNRLSFLGHDTSRYPCWIAKYTFKEPLGNWSQSENWEKIANGELKKEIKGILEKIKLALVGIDL